MVSVILRACVKLAPKLTCAVHLVYTILLRGLYESLDLPSARVRRRLTPVLGSTRKKRPPHIWSASCAVISSGVGPPIAFRGLLEPIIDLRALGTDGKLPLVKRITRTTTPRSRPRGHS